MTAERHPKGPQNSDGSDQADSCGKSDAAGRGSDKRIKSVRRRIAEGFYERTDVTRVVASRIIESGDVSPKS